MAMLKDLRELFGRGRKKAPASPSPVSAPDPNRGATIGADLARRPVEGLFAPERNEWVGALRKEARKVGKKRRGDGRLFGTFEFTHTGWGRGRICDTASMLEQRLLSPCGTWIVCADGFQLSVVAGEEQGSSPLSGRGSDQWPGPWESVEVALPEPVHGQKIPKKLRPYYEDAVRSGALGRKVDEQTLPVMRQVPFDLVVEVIDDHGGFYTGQDDSPAWKKLMKDE